MSGPQSEREARFLSGGFTLGRDDDASEDEGVDLGELEGMVRGLEGIGQFDLRRDNSAPASQAYLEEELSRIKGENSHLKQLVSRLQSELGTWVRKYQSMHPDGTLDEDEEGVENGDEAGPLSPWISSPHVFSPLLLAYDARLRELRHLATNAERQLAEDREHIARLTQENNRLQADLETELANRVRELETEPLQPDVRGGLGEVGAVANETISMLNSIVETLKKENSILEERDSILQRDVERLTEQGKERDEQLVKITQNFQAATVGLRHAKEQIEELRSERDAAANQVLALQAQVNDLSTECERTQSALHEQERETGVLQNHIHKLRIELEDMASKANAESDLQDQHLALTSKRVRQLQFELESNAQELDTLRQAYQELSLKHESIKQDYDNLHVALQATRIENHELKSREEALRQTETSVRSQVEKAILEKNQAIAVATQRKEEIDRLHDQRVQLAKEHVLDKERAVKEAQAELKSLLSLRNSELEEAEKKYVRQNQELEQAKKEQFDTAMRLDSFRKLSDQATRRLEQSVEKLTERVELAETKAIEREAEAQKVEQASLARIAETDQERAKMQEASQTLRQQLQNAMVQIESLKSELKRLAQEAENSDKDAVRLRQELANLRLSTDARVEGMEQRAKSSQQKLTQRLEQAERRAEESEQDSENLRQTMERQKTHHEEEMSSTLQHFERLVSEQKEECSRLRGRTEELSAQLLALQHEKSEIQSLAKQQEAHARKLEKSLYLSDKRATEAKEQVAELLASEERRLRETSELRRKLDAAEIQVNRVIRERDAALLALEEKNNQRRLFLPTDSGEPDSPTRRFRSSLHAQPSPTSRAGRLRVETET